MSQFLLAHLFAAAVHPQTIGKFERLNRTAKAKLRLVIYTSPEELEEAVACFHHWYNHERYQEALGTSAPGTMQLVGRFIPSKGQRPHTREGEAPA